jgi:hypothetical protein
MTFKSFKMDSFVLSLIFKIINSFISQLNSHKYLITIFLSNSSVAQLEQIVALQHCTPPLPHRHGKSLKICEFYIKKSEKNL